MTPESGLDRINDLQKKRAGKLEELAQRVRRAARGNYELHTLAAFLQNAAHLENEAGTLPGASMESTEKKPMQENPRYNPNAKKISF